jgi:hypothetical protein
LISLRYVWRPHPPVTTVLTNCSFQMNPFISFCLYVSARVFVQYLKSRPDDSQTADSLRFLLSAMNALKRRNPLTESFLVQLDVDLEALGVRIPKLRSAFPRSTDSVCASPILSPQPSVPSHIQDADWISRVPQAICRLVSWHTLAAAPAIRSDMASWGTATSATT